MQTRLRVENIEPVEFYYAKLLQSEKSIDKNAYLQIVY